MEANEVHQKSAPMPVECNVGARSAILEKMSAPAAMFDVACPVVPAATHPGRTGSVLPVSVLEQSRVCGQVPLA